MPPPLPTAECDPLDDVGCDEISWCGLSVQEPYLVPTCIRGDGLPEHASCSGNAWLSCGSRLFCSELLETCEQWCSETDLTRCGAGQACDLMPSIGGEWGTCFTPCDPLASNCPDSRACYSRSYTREGYCDYAGGVPEGAECWGEEDCEAGAGCLGVCARYCSPDVANNCPSGFECAEVTTDFGYCVQPCDPFSGTPCGEDEACVVFPGTTACLRAGSGIHGNSCDNGCARGYQCMQHYMSGNVQCHALCDLEGPSSCAAYPGTECEDFGHELVGACAEPD